MNRREILDRAAAWLEANPDKHVQGVLACTNPKRPYSSEIDPMSEQACCFCALGRIAREAELSVDPVEGYSSLETLFTEDEIRAVWRANDGFSDHGSVFAMMRSLPDKRPSDELSA